MAQWRELLLLLLLSWAIKTGAAVDGDGDDDGCACACFPAGLFASLAPESEEKSASELRRRLVEGQI